VHYSAVAGPDVWVVKGRTVDSRTIVLVPSVKRSMADGKEWETYVWHDMFFEIRISVSPCGTVGDDIVGTRCAKFGHHQGGCCCGDYDSAVQVQSSRWVYGSESCVAAAGGEDVWLGASWELFEATENVVADSSIALSVWLSAEMAIV